LQQSGWVEYAAGVDWTSTRSQSPLGSIERIRERASARNSSPRPQATRRGGARRLVLPSPKIDTARLQNLEQKLALALKENAELKQKINTLEGAASLAGPIVSNSITQHSRSRSHSPTLRTNSWGRGQSKSPARDRFSLKQSVNAWSANTAKYRQLEQDEAGKLCAQARSQAQGSNYTLALGSYTKAIKLKPLDHTLYGFRAAMFLQVRNKQSFLKDAHTCIQLDQTVVDKTADQFSEEELKEWITTQYKI